MLRGASQYEGHMCMYDKCRTRQRTARRIDRQSLPHPGQRIAKKFMPKHCCQLSKVVPRPTLIRALFTPGMSNHLWSLNVRLPKVIPLCTYTSTDLVMHDPVLRNRYAFLSGNIDFAHWLVQADRFTSSDLLATAKTMKMATFFE